MPSLHAMRTLLDYMNMASEKIVSLFENDKSDADPYKLLCYGIGAYYEQFNFLSLVEFRRYLLRNLKMQISIPLVKVATALFFSDEEEKQASIYVLCVGFNEELDELVIIHPYTNDYYRLSLNYLMLSEYEFILINFPGMFKPKLIPTYEFRINRYMTKMKEIGESDE